MKRTRGRGCAPVGAVRRAAIAAMLAGTLAAPAPALGATGYEQGSSLSLGPAFPHGLAVDQTSRRLYVAVATTNPLSGAPGHIRRFESNGTAAGTFTAGSNARYSGVAVNPLTQGFYGTQTVLEFFGSILGTSQMDTFSSAGVSGASFALSKTGGTLPQIATDSNGDVYFPNATTDTVQVYNAAGALQESIACTGCPGGAFGRPASVAMNSSDELYVVDLGPDRVIKFTLSGGSYKYSSVLQSGLGAAAVAVNPSTGDVFVGDLPNGRDFHIVAYNSAGVSFDDFGGGLFQDPTLGATVAAQMAVDGTSHRLYVAEEDEILSFNPATITPPTATANPASTVGQLVATLNATVNPKGHAALDCDFEYIADAAFQSNGFVGASTKACSKLPFGSGNVAITANVTGLSPVTTYHHRVTVTTHAGSVTSGSQSFTTLPVLVPTVTTDPATGITETAATIVGRVNPRGGTVTSCRFEYGTTASYGTTTSCKTPVGPVTSDVLQKQELKGLSSGTTYHYRLVLTTNAGTTQGEGKTFSTSSPPPPPPPPDPPPEDPPPSPPLPPAVDPPVAQKPPLRCKKGFVKKRVRGKLRCVKKRPRKRTRRVASPR